MKSDIENGKNGDSKTNETTNLLSQDVVEANQNAIIDLQKVSTQNNQELTQIKDLLVGVKSSIDQLNNTMITINNENRQNAVAPKNGYINNNNNNFGAISQPNPLGIPSISQPGLGDGPINAPIYPPPRGDSNPDHLDGEKDDT